MMSDELLRCRSCRGRTSLTAGTIFEGTRKPLRTWFIAMWFVTSQKNGPALGSSAGARAWQLRDRLDVAAQTAQGDGAAGR